MLRNKSSIRISGIQYGVTGDRNSKDVILLMREIRRDLPERQKSVYLNSPEIQSTF